MSNMRSVLAVLVVAACGGGDKHGSCEFTYAKGSPDGSIASGMQVCNADWVADKCTAAGTGADSVGLPTKDFVFTAGATCESRGFKSCGRGAYYRDCAPPAKQAAEAPAAAAPAAAPATALTSTETCVGMDCAKQAMGFIQTDATKAMSLFTKGCMDKHAISCAMVGTGYAEGLGVAKDLGKANAMFQQACDLGYAKGCYNYGLALANGDGIAADLPKAIPILEKACTGGAWKACGSVGDYRLHNGDTAGAKTILEIGCKNGDALSCETKAKAFGAQKPAPAPSPKKKPSAAAEPSGL
jgi:hypothetical protein